MKKSRLLVAVRAFLLATVAVIFNATAAQAALISGLFNTGVDETGLMLSAGSSELHYALVGPESLAIVGQAPLGSA